jgi:LuxR family maltose regulon positive regulatory protein
VVRPSLPDRLAGSSLWPPQTPYLESRAAEPTAAHLAPPRAKLSAREQEVLRYLPLASEDIATRLMISVNTVKAQLRSIYRKLGVSRRQNAVAEAVKRGLL